jgi:hypothetical protein
MSSIPLLPETERVIKLTPNNDFIPVVINSIDQLFSVSDLSSTKFDLWKTIASTAEKIGVVDSITGLEVSRYIDTNYNISTPAGSLWFLGSAQQNRFYYLQAGASLSKDNSTSVFTSTGHVASNGYMEASGPNLMNRCAGNIDGVPHSHGVSVSYDKAGKIDRGLGFDSTSSIATFNEPVGIPIDGKTKFSVKMLMKKTTADSLSCWAVHGTGFRIFMTNISTCVFTFDALNFAFVVDLTGIITNDNWFLIDVVGDLTQVDDDHTIQNNKRFKVFIDGVRINGTFTADVSSIYPNNPGQAFQFGLTGMSFIGVLDETRVILDRAETENEIVWRYNNWFNQSTYWIVTVQPIILSVVSLGSKKWKVTGSGFIPELTDPTGTIGGTAFIIESVTDTEIILQQGENTPIGEQILVIHNSDNETDNETIVVPDIDEPNWAFGYPKQDSVTMQNANFLIKLDEQCVVYYVVLPEKSVAPTSQQVRAGTDAYDEHVHSGSFSASDIETYAQIKQLSSGQIFDIYFVAEDLALPPNLQTEPVKRTISTARKIPINPDKPGVNFYNLSIAGNSDLDFIVSDIRRFYSGLALPDMKK